MKNRITLAALAALVITTSAFTLRSEASEAAAISAPKLVGNAAFRDGLYMGKLAAENGNQYLAATGRWARDDDRASFATGYDLGYKAQLGAQSSK